MHWHIDHTGAMQAMFISCRLKEWKGMGVGKSRKYMAEYSYK